MRQLIEETPPLSVRRNRTGLRQSSFYLILKNDIEAHPYKIKIMQQLLEPDFSRRMTFCNWLLDHSLGFIDTTVVTDEAAFSINGCANTQNTRHWSTHPPNGNIFLRQVSKSLFKAQSLLATEQYGMVRRAVAAMQHRANI